MLFGVPKPRTTTVNYGVLRPDHVNVLIHGHSLVMHVPFDVERPETIEADPSPSPAPPSRPSPAATGRR